MHRLAVVFVPLLSLGVAAQTLTTQSAIVRDVEAVSLLRQSLAAMTNGVPVSDVALSGTATRIAGSDQESGQAALEAKGTQESRVSLSLSNYALTEARNFVDGAPEGTYAGSDGIAHQLAQHNCFTDAAWFFPALPSLASGLSGQSADVSYIGQETLYGRAVQHVTVWQSASSPDVAAVKAIAHLSAIDWYLDSASAMPIAVRFTAHPPENSSADMAVEVRFSNYQQVNGILLPFHIEKFLNGGLVLDLTIGSATINSGLPDSDFILQ